MKAPLPLVAVFGLLASHGACATGSPSTPTEITAHWQGAATSGDADSARALVLQGAPLWPHADAPVPSGGAPPAESLREARWRLPDGRSLVVVSQDGRLQITAGVLGFGRASTPVEAATLLARALHQHDWALLHTLLPADERWRWTPEQLAASLQREPAASRWRALADAISAQTLTPEWLEPGVRARLVIGESTLVVVSEDDGWKVLDLQPAAAYTLPL